MVNTNSRQAQAGFTLIELIVVVTIIGILASVAVVQVRYAQRRALEAALMHDLTEMRKAIDDFYADKQRFPTDLNELVPNYLRRIPLDPITKAADWETVANEENPEDADSSSFSDSGEGMPQGPGIVDVKCPAPGQTLDGRPYSEL
jgi:general secretion pathway protein G